MRRTNWLDKEGWEDEESLGKLFERDARWSESLRRRARAQAALVLLILAVVLADASTPEPHPIEQDAEIVPLVDQLVPPLIAAPSAPPARQVALLAA